MALHFENIRAALMSTTIEEYWQSCLSEYVIANNEERNSLLAWIQGIRDGFVAHAGDIDDDEELLISVALSYIQLKSQWQMLNTQINYQVFRTGEARPNLTFRSSLLSIIVDEIGKFLTDDDLVKIQEFLLNPTAEPLTL